MTNRIRSYIDLEDVLGLRLECKNCNTALDLPIMQAGKIPMTCPNCREEWYSQYNAVNVAARIADYVSSFKSLKNVLSEESQAKTGFGLSMELTPRDNSATKP